MLLTGSAKLFITQPPKLVPSTMFRAGSERSRMGQIRANPNCLMRRGHCTWLVSNLASVGGGIKKGTVGSVLHTYHFVDKSAIQCGG